MQSESLTRISPVKVCNELVSRLKEQQYTLCVAESCTGGILASMLTDRGGASEFFESGFVTYSNESKQKLLGVSSRTLAKSGAVSENVAKEMLLGALKQSGAEIGIAITGLAGPGGGTEEKPIGMVCFAWGRAKKIQTSTQQFEGNRAQVRYMAAVAAQIALTEYLS